MTIQSFLRYIVILITLIFLESVISCKKIKDLADDNPDLTVLSQGFKSSLAIGYCASIANMAFKGEALPSNVIFNESSSGEYSSSALLYVNISETNPLPFNDNIGDIVIGALWDENKKSGVMSILFADIDILSDQFKFYGIYTVPFIEEEGTGKIITVFAEQDIIIGEGEDTIINIGMTRFMFDIETGRAKAPQPTDVFAAVKQNVWFVKVNHHGTFPNIYDDTYEINGGGQIAEIRDDSGGLIYHALIETRFNYDDCQLNPTHGTGFIQNFKVGSILDLGNITFDFHSSCDGRAHVILAAGKYLKYNARDVNLNF